MPQYVSPRSHADRLQFLARAAQTGQMDIDAGRNYVTQDTIDRINTLMPTYVAAVQAIPVASAARSKEVRERNEAIEVLKVWTRDFWEVLKRRVHRLNQPAEVLVFYGLPLDGIVPKPITASEWIQAAENCVQGDAAAVLAGYPAMQNPAVPELVAVLTAASTEAGQVAETDRVHDEALAGAASLVPDVDAVIDDVMEELRFNTRKMDFPSQRRIQRTYGARFITLPGEPDDGHRVQVIDTGNGMQTTFATTLEDIPIVPESVSVSDGITVLTETDPEGDGTGQFGPPAQGTGTVNYASGVLSVTFLAPPPAGAEVQVQYERQ